MPIVSVEIMKIVDERETQKTTTTTTTKKQTNKDRKEQGGTKAIAKLSALTNFDVHLS